MSGEVFALEKDMQIVIGSDHAGVELKAELVDFIETLGHQTTDVGPQDAGVSVDFPDYAEKVGRAVVSGKAARGIMICGSGVGGVMASNKINGIRAGLCHDVYSAHQGVEHDDMNVLCLGSRVVGIMHVREIVQAFLGAHFVQDERFTRRVNKITALETHK